MLMSDCNTRKQRNGCIRNGEINDVQPMTSSSCALTHSQIRSSANASRYLPSARPAASGQAHRRRRKSLCPSAAHPRPTQRPPHHYCLSHGKPSRPALQHVPRHRITHTVLKEKHQVAFCLAHLHLVRAGQTSPPRRQNTRCHCCMSIREHESHGCMREHERHRECDKIRCSEAVDV
jgi:hypothetical protein